MKEVENLANKLLKLSEEKAELEIKNEALEIENLNLKTELERLRENLKLISRFTK